VNQRYMMIAGTVRQILGPNNTIDVPTIIRLDTKTGEAWFLEGIMPTGFSWFNVVEKGAPPPHD
jgi:hypothetical protein